MNTATATPTPTFTAEPRVFINVDEEREIVDAIAILNRAGIIHWTPTTPEFG